ncbi:biotin/lipoate A/B protein ligase family protein [Planctomyces sp. SH-PL14]|uniref:lipoate--protein ligase family protein n=1 Tax=Planctomyces sp. SH-PL14 TaxID=1632864 RepID=UPI00078E88DC|nr:biotin/lipoate A/B protein ligase family protein [Planctomyces sp. SH-PL14]AMV20946.1 Octanoyltransferase LipM [Planctomyces sp. SH-PL14]
MSFLLIEPAPQPGDWNMAVDAWLLDRAVDHHTAAARLYEWNAPTVSLGHFQKLTDPAVSGRFAPLPKVRRLSGGGAILHDRELTYSLAVPAEHSLARDPTGLYSLVHDRIIAVLAAMGVESRMRGEARSGPEPFLCFGRGDPRDIVLGPHKILGSAQRRRRGAILQHGALLLAQSPHADEFPGIAELTGGAMDLASLREALAIEFQTLLGSADRRASLERDEDEAVRGFLHAAAEDLRSETGP